MRALLGEAGRRIFGYRLYVGLAVVLPALVWLDPQPFLAAHNLARQLAALCCIALGVGLRAWASGHAGQHTRAAEIAAPRLITAGPFAHVRNPIYLGTICLGTGMAALIGDPLAYALAALAFLLLYLAIVPAEEQFLAEKFGRDYAQYRAAVPCIVPRLRAYLQRTPGDFRWTAARGELSIALILVVIYSLLHLAEHWEKTVRS